MFDLMLTHRPLLLLLQATAYIVAPLSSLDPSVKIVSPTLSRSASPFASFCSSTAMVAPSFSGAGHHEYPIVICSFYPMADGAPAGLRASLPCGRLSSRALKRLYLFSSWAVAGDL